MPGFRAQAIAFGASLAACFFLTGPRHAWADQTEAVATSPDGRNSIALRVDAGLKFEIRRDGRRLFDPAPLGPVLAGGDMLNNSSRIVDVQSENLDETFPLVWGKTATVENRCAVAVVTVETRDEFRWQIELRAYDDGVAFRYRILSHGGAPDVTVRDEATQFAVAGNPTALFTGFDKFTSSHEGLYESRPVAELPGDKLLEMPLLLEWADGPAAAITEAGVRDFAGMMLQRDDARPAVLRCRLSPLPERPEAAVIGPVPLASPWRVVLLADEAGQLLESNLLLCLNDPPPAALGDFAWLKPGKTSFHWWYGAFEDDFQSTTEPGAFLARHKRYIDFCAAHNIAYHGVSGDGRAWYPQSSASYGVPSADADVRIARPEMHLPEIIEYARGRGVGIRLWVHWKPLSEHLDEAFANYQRWGVTGLMVDFLNRDDQPMNAWTERMLASAARHHLNIQIHGSPKPTGLQRTFPNLVNREGVKNLEYLKWGNEVTPAHNVNVAYTRALAGPVDYHHGGFRSVSRTEFVPHDRAPTVLGTRCHHLALYVVYENPLPMVADDPSSYEGQPGFDFLEEAPTTWDETRFVCGEPGEYVVVARRRGDAWYLGGITNWMPRELDVPLTFLGPGEFAAKLYVDGSLDEAEPNAIELTSRQCHATTALPVNLAPGGGFVGVLRPL